MTQQQYGILALCLSVLACGVLLALHRRRRERYLAVWIAVWILLAGHYEFQVLSLSGFLPWAQAGSGALMVLAALLLAAGATTAQPALRMWHAAAAAVGVAWSIAHAYVWPQFLVRVSPEAASSLLLLYAAIRFWRRSRTTDSLGQRLLTLGTLLLGGALGMNEVAPVPGHRLLVISYTIAPYSLVVLAVAMAVAAYEEQRRGVQENLLGLSGLNLATSGYQTAHDLQEILAQVLERILNVCRLSQGLMTLERTNGQPGTHLFRGFQPEVASEWERRSLDQSFASLVERMGGMVMLPDLQETADVEGLDPAERDFREVMRQAGAEAALAVALQTKAGRYGALVLAHPTWRAFSEAELNLLATLGGQVAMAVENFLLLQESHRHAEELRLLNQTGQALSSTLNPDALLRLIHQEIQKLMDARNFYIALWNEEQGEIRFELEVDQGVYLPKRRRKGHNGLTEYVLRTREPLLLKEKPEAFRVAQRIDPSQQPARCWMGVPLLLYDRAIGVMAVQNFERENAYDEGHLDIMKTLAAQAAIALENARLFAEEQRRMRQLSFLNNITRIAISTLNAEEMPPEIAREIQKNFAYDHIGIGLLDYQTKEIEIKAEAGQSAQALGRRIPLDVGVIGRVARTGEMLLVNDLMQEKRTQGILSNARSVLCLPVIYADQMLGVLNVESTHEAAFHPEDVMILRTLADQLATALHNAFTFQRTRQQAITDGLTGVKTHQFFMEALQAEWNRAARAGRGFSVVLLDLDRFKQVNDTMGHLEGDLVLARLGKLLEQRCRHSNVVARYGGDEFMILMPEAGAEQGHIMAERLRLWIATDPMFSERKLTASFGLATYPLHGSTPEELIRAADAGLYLAKHQGGNMVGVGEQFRRQEPGRWHGHVLSAYLENLSRRLELTGPETMNALLQRLEEAWPAFPGDPVELERAVLEGMTALTETVEARVYGGSAHQQAVARSAVMLAAALGLSERERDALQAAGRIQNIGYLAVPASILTKPGKLTPSEFAAVQTHPGAGARLLEAARVNPAIVALVRHHHEFFNGTGYPDGMRAEDIPLGARILAVADAFHALTSDRPHRRARSVAEALEELERFAGTQFDPALAKTFVDLVRSREAKVPSEP